ncbi:hypothetical protein K474DRAFT_881768 [Panus rudis PR-1116 ss-1]|nr:hypothetical protein K474DRAFT_128407 [Panus rudis PR-1116 ss-1]KAI0078563.1 hypothetical protein K474DRAFT_881768 [Panus rudis PR-1116 ss-1]
MPKFNLTITPDVSSDDDTSRGVRLSSNQAPVVVVVNMTPPSCKRDNRQRPKPKPQKPEVIEIPDSDNEQASTVDKRTRAGDKKAAKGTAAGPSNKSESAGGAGNGAQSASTMPSTAVASTSTEVLAVAAGTSSASATNGDTEAVAITDAAMEVEDTEEEELRPPPRKLLRRASERRREKERERMMDQRSYIMWM